MSAIRRPGLGTLAAVSLGGWLALAGCTSAPGRRDASPTAEPSVVVAPSLGPPAGHAVTGSPSTGKTPPLTRDEARRRARQVNRVTYGLWFGLDESRDSFEGRTTIRFDLREKARDAGKDLFLDFAGGSIRSISLNGAPLDPRPQALRDRWDGARLRFKLSELQTAANRIEIAYVHPYSTNGAGLYRFQDPEDQRVYLYTDLEPYSARQVFPCFDQPDIKASFEVTVEAPASWKVIANTPERERSEGAGRASWTFPPSPLFSTYLFALHAGPFHAWKGDAHGIPLRLLARESFARYVDAREWLRITAEGLDFFEVKFGYPYPYGKYDQILVPDFNSGAMENVAAVTFTERYVSRSRETRDERRHRAGVILHEMAHMWFGNLVTMEWWNGLWLNESFATLMQTWAEADRPGGSGAAAWSSFQAGLKAPAYAADARVSTHPVEVPVPDTDVARANFDDITYGKGASALRQLLHSLGEDDFLEGVQRYIQRHALRNTTMHDFFRSLAEAAGAPLGKWQRQWLQTVGANTVRADWTCGDDGRVSRFELRQEAPPPPAGAAPTPGNELRAHRAGVAFYRAGRDGALRKLPLLADPRPRSGGRRGRRADDTETRETLDVAYSEAVTPVPAAVGQPCPDFVFPNAGDFDYARMELDARSTAAAKRGLGRIDDALTRQMTWDVFWNGVLEGRMRAQEYIDLAIAQAARESDTETLEKVLRSLVREGGGEPSALKFLDGDERAAYRRKIESFADRGLARAAAGSDAQALWFDAWARVAAGPLAQDRARALLAGRAKLPGFKLDLERRWQLVSLLARDGAARAPETIAREQTRDPSDRGLKEAIGAEAQLPDPAGKSRWLARILRQGGAPEGGDTLATLSAAMKGYAPLGQEDAVRASVDAYFGAIPRLARDADEEYALTVIDAMYPSLCDQTIVRRTGSALEVDPPLPAGIARVLKEKRQAEERCVRARALSRTPG